MDRDSTDKARTARLVLVRAVMSRTRIEAVLVALLAACGGSTEGGTSTTSSSGSSGSSSSSSSSGSSGTSSSGAWVGCGDASLERTETYELDAACENYEARTQAANDAGADGGSDGGADGGSFDCAALSCSDLCHVVGGDKFGGIWNGTPDMCKKTTTELACTIRHPCGRRFAAMEEPSTNDVLRDAAYLEAASVIAFEHLARDLASHEAPFALLERALRAAEDERRHTRMVHALAGGRWPEPNATEWRPRELVDIAIENVVEGCVGETWGALVALAQARNARSREVRETFAAIASDEIDHAALAHDLDAWIRPFLSDEEQRAVQEARAAAWSRFEIDIDPSIARELGIPNGDASRRMLAALASTG
jgi:hypothetical protein